MNFYTLFHPVRKKRVRTLNLLLVMKLVIFLLTVACLQVSASATAQKITLNEKDAPLEKIFSDIKDQAGYNFFYEHNCLNGTAKVTINVKDASLPDVLNLCLANQPLVYTIAGKNVGVKKKEAETAAPTKPLPTKDIIGQVTNKSGQPLEGATVLIKRTQSGTLTDAKGNFIIRNVEPADILLVSYLGYKQAAIAIGPKTVYNIVLDESTNDLDQVVIKAYGQTTNRLNTGDIATVTSAEIEKQPVMNVLSALEGKVPGLEVQQTSGYASAPFKVELRGRSVVDPNSPPSEPLYIIDGVPLNVLNLNGQNYASGSTGFIQSGFTGPANGQSPLFSINPQDIESISVLKDADATAIYGSRGANGVIIITTKKGKAGNTQCEGNVYQGISKVTGRYDLMNSQQYEEMRLEAFKNDGIIPNVGNAYDLLVWNSASYSDWQKEDWGQTGHTTDVDLNISGGDKQNTFRIGGDYHTEVGTMTRAGADQRGSVQFNYNHKSQNQKLGISFASIYSYSQSDLVNVSGNILEAPDAPPILDSQGRLNWAAYSVSTTGSIGNWAALFQPYVAKTGFLNTTFHIQYELVKGLTFSTQLGYSTSNGTQNQIYPIISQNPLYNPTGNSAFGNNNYSSAIVEPQLEYNHLLGKGKINVLVGGTAQSISQSSDVIFAQGYTDDNLLGSAGNAPLSSSTSNYGQYKYAAIFGQLNYNLEDKYLLNLSGRRDGSSLFGPGHQFGNFGSVGAAWIFTEENWFKNNLSWLSFGKLRGSYGLTGSDLINSYLYLSQWSASGIIPYQGNSSYVPLIHANPDLHWQTNKKLEAALDLGFFKDRILLDVAWYRDRCGDQLIATPLPVITGFNTVEANSPALIQNEGVEGSLNIKVIDNSVLKWSVNFNIASNNNKLLAYPNLATSPYAFEFKIGQSMNTTYVLHYTGIDPLTGQYTFEDKNHDGQITNYYNNGNNDLIPLNIGIKYSGGFGTNISYKSFQLYLFFYYRKQLLPSSIYTSPPGYIEFNQSVEALNRWQKPGDQSEFARYTTRPTQSDFEFLTSDGGYSDGSFIRLKNLSLSYDLNSNWIKKIGLQKCQVFVRGENLLLFTKFNGLDPEAGFGQLPPSKILTAGLKFTL